MMYKRSESGISLVALVLTIIVMVILAGISMSALFGDNGIVQQAMRSKQKTEYAAATEMIEMAWSARMTRFLEETNVTIDDDYLEMLKNELNANLGGAGTILAIEKNDYVDNSLKIIYQNDKGTNFVMNIARSSGEVSVLGTVGGAITNEAEAKTALNNFEDPNENNAIREMFENVLASKTEDFDNEEDLKNWLNTELEDKGSVVGIEYDETSNSYRIMFRNKKGSNFAISVAATGGTTSVLAKVTEPVETEEEVISVLDNYKVPVNKASLYGRGVYTGVSSVEGPTGDRVILSTDVYKAGTYVSDTNPEISEVEGDSSTYNWKVFYIDKDNVYLIYRDYYPNKALLNLDENIMHGGELSDAVYEVYGKKGDLDAALESHPNRDLFINYLKSSSNWSNIVSSFTEAGKPFAGYASRITATGGPTMEMWIDSVNEKYNDHLGYTTLRKDQIFKYKGYASSGDTTDDNKVAAATGTILTMDKTTNPLYYCDILPQHLDTTGSDTMDDRLSYSDGIEVVTGASNSDYMTTLVQYGEYTNNLYYPRKSALRHYYRNDVGGYQNGYVFGYWLLSPSAAGNEYVYACWVTGGIGRIEYSSAIQATRPLVKIPRSIYEDVTNVKIVD